MSTGLRSRRRSTAPARAHDLTTFFAVSSWSELGSIQLPDVELALGSPFHIEFDVELPLPFLPNPGLAFLFDLPGAELLFRGSMPPGLELRDVRSISSKTVLIEMRVRDVAVQGQGATMGLLPLLAGIATFLATRWVILTLGAIGLTLTLNAITNAIRGRGLAAGIPDPTGPVKNIVQTGALIGAGLLVFLAISNRRA